MTGVRGPDFTTLFVAIEREDVGVEFVGPECLLERATDSFRLCGEPFGNGKIAQAPRQIRGRAARRVDVSLYFA